MYVSVVGTLYYGRAVVDGISVETAKEEIPHIPT